MEPQKQDHEQTPQARPAEKKRRFRLVKLEEQRFRIDQLEDRIAPRGSRAYAAPLGMPPTHAAMPPLRAAVLRIEGRTAFAVGAGCDPPWVSPDSFPMEVLVMEPQKQDHEQDQQSRPEQKKRRFRLVKVEEQRFRMDRLEDRIAPTRVTTIAGGYTAHCNLTLKCHH